MKMKQQENNKHLPELPFITITRRKLLPDSQIMEEVSYSVSGLNDKAARDNFEFLLSLQERIQKVTHTK